MPPISSYKIPGFEDCTYAQGGMTDFNKSKRVLTNKDALLLIIAAHIRATGASDMRVGLIAGRHSAWRGERYPHIPSLSLAAPYFNTAYGHVGSTHLSTVARGKGGKPVTTYWYRTRQGHYALTEAGSARAAVARLHIMHSDTLSGSTAQPPMAAAAEEKKVLQRAKIDAVEELPKPNFMTEGITIHLPNSVVDAIAYSRDTAADRWMLKNALCRAISLIEWDDRKGSPCAAAVEVCTQ